MKTNDLAGKKYWDTIWNSTKTPRLAKYKQNLADICYHKFLNQYLPKGKLKFLEVGCGGSCWLSYFAKEFSYEVYGIDYSYKGVELETEILKTQGICGTIIYGDFLNCDSLLEKGPFDIVLSFGLIEHYTQPIVLLNKMKDFLKPNGLIITVIPNFQGFMKFFHFLVGKESIKVHLIILPEDLDSWQKKIGLQQVLSASYFGFFSFGIVNWDSILYRVPKIFHYPFLRIIQIIDEFLKLFPLLFNRLFGIKLFSPYIVSIYKKI